jgi:hypothetical protein
MLEFAGGDHLTTAVDIDGMTPLMLAANRDQQATTMFLFSLSTSDSRIEGVLPKFGNLSISELLDSGKNTCGCTKDIRCEHGVVVDMESSSLGTGCEIHSNLCNPFNLV